MKPRYRKRLRTMFSYEQIRILEAAYKICKYPDACIKKQIATRLELPVDRIQVWFQNKRTRDMKQNRRKSEDKRMDDRNTNAERGVSDCFQSQSEVTIGLIPWVVMHCRYASGCLLLRRNVYIVLQRKRFLRCSVQLFPPQKNEVRGMTHKDAQLQRRTIYIFTVRNDI